MRAGGVPVGQAPAREVDRARRTSPLPAGPLPAGATLQVELQDGAQLGNGGGSLTLLDGRGLKVAGVSYTGQDGGREGWTVVF